MLPVFSIIIPTYNRPGQLADCLAALAQLDYPPDRFEVLVVDDGGAVSPASVVDRFQKHLAIKLIRQANAGPGSARNTGAKNAKGQILAFTDDDCLPQPGWLRTLAMRFLSAPDSVIVGGHVVNLLVNNRYAVASQLIVDVGHAYHNNDPEQARFFTANNLAIPADRFRELGGFDVTFGTTASEDRDICGRWLHRGYRMISASEAVVGHAHRLTWRSFCQQHFNYGRGAIRLQRARKHQGWKLFSPDPNYYRSLLQAPFSRLPLPQATVLAGLLFLSQAISAMGMMAEWIRQRQEQTSSPIEA
jgi:glycosyltransferase involved in cell wall biosynthesis